MPAFCCENPCFKLGKSYFFQISQLYAGKNLAFLLGISIYSTRISPVAFTVKPNPATCPSGKLSFRHLKTVGLIWKYLMRLLYGIRHRWMALMTGALKVDSILPLIKCVYGNPEMINEWAWPTVISSMLYHNTFQSDFIEIRDFSERMF